MPVTDQELQAALEDVATMAYYFALVGKPFLDRYRAVIPQKVAAAFSNQVESVAHLHRLREQRIAERNPHA
jgi:hypothetical protein